MLGRIIIAMGKKKLKLVDIDWIISVMEDNSPMCTNYIHVPTGSVWNENCPDYDKADIERNEDDYYFIASLPSSEGFKVMEDFVRGEVKEPDIQNRLFEELSKNKPFRRFKDMLCDYPDIQKRFYQYKDDRMKKYLIEVLEADGFEVTIENRWTQVDEATRD
jgi:hypothetical protein